MTGKSRQQQEVKAAGNTHPKQEIGESPAACRSIPFPFQKPGSRSRNGAAHPANEKRLIYQATYLPATGMPRGPSPWVNAACQAAN